MDLTQSKLSRQEWINLETAVPPAEKNILNILNNGYDNTNISINKNLSLIEILKIEYSENVETYLYEKYFKKMIDEINKKYEHESCFNLSIPIKLQKIKSGQMIKLQNFDINKVKDNVFEFTLIELYKHLLRDKTKGRDTYTLYVYTIIQLLKTKIKNINSKVKQEIMSVISELRPNIDIKDVIKNSYKLIEQNLYLLEYQDIELFNHQKRIYDIYKTKDDLRPSLVLYTAPTGTGKTMTPIGLSNQYKIIFVCVARHIGLALAKSAISMNKKIAFAFGCDSSSEIRLHYYAVSEYLKSDKTGEYLKYRNGQRKPDNTVGDKVEIMICDVKSYLSAMDYMLTFNKGEKIITFWDEPTITLDYENHELHSVISKNWKENQIPNLILSCATLPQTRLIHPCIETFTNKFNGAAVYNVTSNECKKSIPLIDVNQKYVCIHTMHNTFTKFRITIDHIEQNKALLRYLDLHNIISFIEYFNIQFMDNDNMLHIYNYFENDITNITMDSIKNYYLKLLRSINNIDNFEQMYNHFNSINTLSKPVFNTNSKGIQFTTSDSHTLTDGPTIFICEDVHKISSFYIQQSNINEDTFKRILAKIGINDKFQKKINEIESLIAAKEEKMSNAKEENVTKVDNEDKDWYNKINQLKDKILLISLDAKYVPNTVAHQTIWNNEVNSRSFMPTIDDQNTKEIMSLSISNNLKVLLLLGIGVFVKDTHIDYTELMKKMAIQQKLFIIIASSDYIYGTNYQFCHGIIGKDLDNMSQQKIIQALGRIGRNNIQQNYTVRFRTVNTIHRLFKPDEINIEANNMLRLFC